MADTLVSGCAVTQRAAGANMSVDVALGAVATTTSRVNVTAANLAIAAADLTQDRIDAVVVTPTTGVLSVITGSIFDGLNAQPPDTTGFEPLTQVYVFNQAHPSYTGTIVNAVIGGQPRDVIASASGTLIKRTVYTTGSGTHTFDATATKARIVATGGGGGGGGASTAAATNTASAAAGGGAGATVDVHVTLAASTATYAVGAAGAAGLASGGAAGGDGGDTTVTHNAVTYTGGKGFGGVGGSTGVTTTRFATGGNGGTATGGDLNIAGEPGENGFAIGGTAASGGNGGSSLRGGGGASASAQAAASTAGGDGGSYGAGGAGAISVRVAGGTGSGAGGAGVKGVITIEEFT